MIQRLSFVLALLVTSPLGLPAQAMDVWVISDGLKVKIDGRLWNRAYEQKHPDYRLANAVWDDGNNLVSLSAAGNEVVAFQVVIQARTNLENLDISFQMDTSAKASIPAARGSVFQEKYIELIAPSRFSDGRRATASLGPGAYPDALIPLQADAGANRPALAAGAVAVFWVDLDLPGDLPGDLYTNLLVITTTDESRILRIRTTVLNYALPIRHSLPVYWQFFPTSFWRGEQLPETWFGAPGNWSLIYDYYRLAAAHRADLVLRGVRPAVTFDPRTGEITALDWTYYDRYMGPILDGSIFTSPDLIPLVVEAPLREDFPAGRSFAGGPFGSVHKRAIQNWAQQIVQHFKDRGWPSRLICYFEDEPNTPQQYIAHQHYSRWIEEAVGDQIAYLITEQPFDADPYRWNSRRRRAQFPSLMQAPIDIWAAVALLAFPDDLRAVQQTEAEAWVYQWDEPYIGGQFIDADGLSLRTWGLIAWHYQLDGLLYWAVNFWPAQPYENPLSQGQLNGDGTLFYPGAPLGQAGPISSVRMKAFRRGLLDYEYLKLLYDLDPGNPLLSQTDRILERALGAGNHRNGYRERRGPGAWSRDPDEWIAFMGRVAAEVARLK